MILRGVAAGAVCSLMLLAGCDLDAKEPPPGLNDAIAQIREQVEGQRQCASLLSGTWPIEFSADSLATPRVDALVAAGLIRRVPLRQPAEDRLRVRIEPTATGSRDIWLSRREPGGPGQPTLCYGQKHVVAVRFERRNLGALTGTPVMGNVVRYDYRTVKPPAWTERDDIRAAFPFLQRELSQVRTAEQPAFLSDGRWTLIADNGRNIDVDLPDGEGFFE